MEKSEKPDLTKKQNLMLRQILTAGFMQIDEKSPRAQLDNLAVLEGFGLVRRDTTKLYLWPKYVPTDAGKAVSTPFEPTEVDVRLSMREFYAIQREIEDMGSSAFRIRDMKHPASEEWRFWDEEIRVVKSLAKKFKVEPRGKK